MVVTGKKGQNIRREVRIRISKPTEASLTAINGTAQASNREQLSGDFFRLLARLLAATGLIILVLTQLLHWRVAKEKTELERVATINATMRQEHAKLTAQRNELASKPRIVASAAAKLGLHLPTKEQEHRLD